MFTIGGEPPRTQFDLNFSIAGFPVRVSPFFWLIALIFSAQLGDGPSVLIGIAVLFVSILVHELGHTFAMRYYREPARIVLYLMGGLAIRDESPWQVGSGKPRTSRQQIIISAAGPAAGFALAGVVIAVVFLAGGQVTFDFRQSIVMPWQIYLGADANPRLLLLVHVMLFVNIFWGLVNLLPVYPLDGGQIAREIMIHRDPWNGLRQSLWLSVATGGVAAVLGVAFLGSIFMAFLFGSLAVSSWMMLQQITGGGGPWGGGGRPW